MSEYFSENIVKKRKRLPSLRKWYYGLFIFSKNKAVHEFEKFHLHFLFL